MRLNEVNEKIKKESWFHVMALVTPTGVIVGNKMLNSRRPNEMHETLRRKNIL